MLTGRERTGLDGTLGRMALFALEEQFFAFATAQTTLGTDIPSHFRKPPALNATLLRRTATIMRDWRHVGDICDFEAHVIERTYGRLSARARTLYPNFHILHAIFLRYGAG